MLESRCGKLERNLPKDLCDKIVSVFPKEETLAIIVFGSYGTQRQRIDSDIDIAWIPSYFVNPIEIGRKTYALKQLLQMEVDLKIVRDYYPVLLRHNILQGDVIYADEDFYDYFYEFYFNHKDCLDSITGGNYNVF